MSQYERKTIEELIDGTIDSYKLKEMLSNFKDADRFEKYISILQERVPWNDSILLPAGLHLYIVQKQNGDRIVKCDCGHEFCDEKDNWKPALHLCSRRFRKNEGTVSKNARTRS